MGGEERGEVGSWFASVSQGGLSGYPVLTVRQSSSVVESILRERDAIVANFPLFSSSLSLRKSESSVSSSSERGGGGGGGVSSVLGGRGGGVDISIGGDGGGEEGRLGRVVRSGEVEGGGDTGGGSGEKGGGPNSFSLGGRGGSA